MTASIKTEVCSEVDTLSTLPTQLTPPDTPRPSRKRRRDSEDSDASYVPPPQHTKRAKYKLQTHRTKLTAELLEYMNKPAKRGRPPKIRDSCDDSIISSISSSSSNFDKFKSRRDKNNIASQRSRFKRKEKELLLELEAENLYDRNKNLKISVDSLEKKVEFMKTLLHTAVLGNV